MGFQGDVVAVIYHAARFVWLPCARAHEICAASLGVGEYAVGSADCPYFDFENVSDAPAAGRSEPYLPAAEREQTPSSVRRAYRPFSHRHTAQLRENPPNTF